MGMIKQSGAFYLLLLAIWTCLMNFGMKRVLSLGFFSFSSTDICYNKRNER